jgi:hypothetical protein
MAAHTVPPLPAHRPDGPCHLLGIHFLDVPLVRCECPHATSRVLKETVFLEVRTCPPEAILQFRLVTPFRVMWNTQSLLRQPEVFTERDLMRITGQYRL